MFRQYHAVMQGCAFTYLIQVARGAEVSIALGAHIFVPDVIPVLLTVILPVRSIPVVTPLTHNSATLFAAVIEQIVPGRAIEIALGALVMVLRVAYVLIKRVVELKGAVATVARPLEC